MKLEELRRLVRESVESGPGSDAEAVFLRLREKYLTMLSETKPDSTRGKIEVIFEPQSGCVESQQNFCTKLDVHVL